MNTMYYLCVHHSGPIGSSPYSSSQGLTLSRLNQAHAARDFNESFLGYFVGYNFLVCPDGMIIQTRAIGEETCAQKGHNFDTVSICILGNFTTQENGLPVDVMPSAQKLAFLNLSTNLIRGIVSKYEVITGTQMNINLSRVFPHRVLQPKHTECYGNYYPDTWARDEIAVRMRGELNVLIASLLSLVERLKLFLAPRSVGGSDYSCDGHTEI